jgi:hypothetical protein
VLPVIVSEWSKRFLTRIRAPRRSGTIYVQKHFCRKVRASGTSSSVASTCGLILISSAQPHTAASGKFLAQMSDLSPSGVIPMISAHSSTVSGWVWLRIDELLNSCSPYWEL